LEIRPGETGDLEVRPDEAGALKARPDEAGVFEAGRSPGILGAAPALRLKKGLEPATPGL
jgi:hypothetical protein